MKRALSTASMTLPVYLYRRKNGLLAEMISVIIPVYNGCQFLRAAVQSVLNEDRSTEVIVVDDGSTDGSLSTVQDLPVTALRSERNEGFPAALNRGLKAVKTEWITFLDSDDEMVPGTLTARMAWLKKNPGERALGGIVDHSREIPQRLTSGHFAAGKYYPTTLWLYLLHHSLLSEVGEFDLSCDHTVDTDYIFRVLRVTSIPLIPLVCVKRRIHAGNRSRELRGDHRRLKRALVAEAVFLFSRYGYPLNHE